MKLLEPYKRKTIQTGKVTEKIAQLWAKRLKSSRVQGTDHPLQPILINDQWSYKSREQEGVGVEEQLWNWEMAPIMGPRQTCMVWCLSKHSLLTPVLSLETEICPCPACGNMVTRF